MGTSSYWPFRATVRSDLHTISEVWTMCTMYVVNLIVVSAVIAAVSSQISTTQSPFQANVRVRKIASCRMQPEVNSTYTVSGEVIFFQFPGIPLYAYANLTGLPILTAASSAIDYVHPLHVHQYGDISGGCNSTGPHYNPKGVTHGAPYDIVRHPGSFGNLWQSPDGRINETLHDDQATMFGAESIIGRALVLHNGYDDYGRGGNTQSLIDGNSGERVACCVIGYRNRDEEGQ